MTTASCHWCRHIRAAHTLTSAIWRGLRLLVCPTCVYDAAYRCPSCGHVRAMCKCTEAAMTEWAKNLPL